LQSVAPREGRVSRNTHFIHHHSHHDVAPREGRVSRNLREDIMGQVKVSRAPRGACE